MKFKKGTKKMLGGKTPVKVEYDMGNGLVLVDISGAFRVVNKSNLK